MIASLRIPYFAATTARDSGSPLILARFTGRRGRVYAVDARADEAGVVRDMPLGRARALCPEAVITPAAPDRDRRALQALLVTLTEFSDRLETAPDHAQTARIDIDLGRLRPRDGLALAESLLLAVSVAGYSAALGLAGNRFTAATAAQFTEPGCIEFIPRGQEGAFLARLPVDLLPLDAETARRLDLLGLHTLGQLAALPRGALMEQFGADARRLHRLASGDDDRRVARFVPERVEQICRAFDPAVDDRLLLERVLHELAAALDARLKRDDLAVHEVTLIVHTDDRTQHEATFSAAHGISGAMALYRRLCGLLGRLTPDSGVTALDVRLTGLSPLIPRQLGLFDRGVDDLRGAVIPLVARYGACFYRPQMIDPDAPLPELTARLEGIDIA